MSNNNVDITLLAGLSPDSFDEIINDIKAIQKRLAASGIKLQLDIDVEQLAKRLVVQESTFKKVGTNLAKQLIDGFGVIDRVAKQKIKELSDTLQSIRIGEIESGVGNDALADTMKELTNVVLNNANLIQSRLGIYDKFYDYLKKISTIKISDSVKADLGDDWNTLRQVYPKKFSTTKGIELDSIYQELTPKFPDLFSGTSHPADQFREITTAIKNYRADVNQIKPIEASDLVEDSIYEVMIAELSKIRTAVKNTDITESIKNIENEAQSMDNVATAAERAARDKRDFADANKDVRESAEDTAQAVNREHDAMMDMNDLDSILANINMHGQQGANIFDSLGDSFRNAFSAYTLANLFERTLDKVVDAGQEAVETVADLNKEATSLMMATGADRSVINQYMTDYNALASDLGFLTADISRAADSYLRQGHDVADTNELIRDSLILSKVSELETADSTAYLTAIMKAYKLQAEEIIGVVDRLSAVDLSAAVDAGGIAEAMSKTAVSAQLAGVSIDQLISMVSVVGETSQAGMSEVGNAIRTIFSRMRDVRDGNLSSIGDDGTIEDLSNIEGTLEAVGIKLRESNNEFRNMFDVLDDTASKWSKLSTVQRAAVGEAYSGVRQSEKFYILMENWDKVREYIEVSEQSTGIATEKFDAYLSSIEAHSNSLMASLERLATTTISDELYVKLLDIAKAMVDTASDTGILKSALIGLGTSASLYGIQQLVGFAHNAAQGFANLSEALNITKAGNIGQTELQRLIDLTGGLSQSQTRLLLSSQNLTEVQRVSILMNQGLSRAEAQAQLQAWGLATAQNGAASATITLGSALKGLWATLLANPMILVTVGVTALVSAFTKYKQSIEEAKQATKEAAQEASTLTNELADLTNRYLELSEAVKTDESAKESLLSTQEELLKKLNLEGESVDNLIDKYGSLSEAIRQTTLDTLKQAQIDLIAGLDTAREELLDAGEKGFFANKNSIYATGDDAIKAFEVLEEAGVITKASYGSGGGGIALTGDDETPEGILENYQKLDDALKALRDSGKFAMEELSENPLYKEIYNRWNEMRDEVEAYQSAISDLNSNLAQQTMLGALQGMELPDTEESFEQFRQNLIDTAIASKQFIGTAEEIEATINNYLASVPEFAQYYGLDTIPETVETSVEVKLVWDQDKFNEEIKSYEDAYKKLQETVEEYTQTGAISPSTFVELQENGLLQYLEYTSEGLVANTDKLIENAQSLKDKAVADLQAAMTEDMLGIALNDTARISQAGQTVIAKLGDATEQAGDKALSSVADWATLGQTISGVLATAGVEDINTDQWEQMSAVYDYYKDLADSIGKIDITAPSRKSGGSGASKAKTKEVFDWIETKLSRIQRTISNLGKTVSATWKRWSTRNNALAQEMSAINFEIATQQQALNTYMAKANSVGLSEEYKELIRNGGFRIDEITDESTKENVKLYQEWYEKALACEDAIIDLQDSLADLAKTKFDNISKQYDDRIAMIEHHTSMLEGYVSRAEAAGFWASEVYYQKMAEKELENINQLQGKYNDLTNALNESIANGSVELYSEQWYEMKIGINDVESALQEANTALVEFNQTLQQIHWDLFDRGVDYKNLFIEESNFLAEMISRRDLYNEVGKLTAEGQAVQGLHAVNYNAYMEQSEAFAEEIKRLNAEIANDPNDLELIDRRNELIGLQQEAIKNAMAEKDAIKDLIEEAYGAMLDSLQELIDKRKEALNSTRDLYDYQNTISEKTDTIASYQKQLQAYAGDNSEEAKATIQKLQVSLEDAEKDLQDTQYERWLNDQQSMLDDLYNQSEEWVNTRIDNIDGLIAEAIQATNDNATSIGDTIISTAETLGTNLSDYATMLWTGNNDNSSLLLKGYEDVANGIDAGTTRLETVLGSIDTKLQTMVDDLNEQAYVEAETIEQPDVVINETNHYDSGATEPQPSSGGGITFTGGTFYEDSYKGGKTGNSKSQWTGREVEVTHESDTGMVHIVDKATGTVLGWVDPDQLQGYAKGTRNAKKGLHKVAENGNEIIQNNDGSIVLANGMQLYPFEGGETVYNAFETDKMLNSNLIPLDTSSFMQNIINKASIPNVSNVQNRNNNINISLEKVVLPNVTDYNGFVSQLQTAIKYDTRTQRLMQAAVLDPCVGRHSMHVRSM